MTFIKIDSLNFNYNNEQIISNLNLEIKQGDFIALVGPSGSGKSTLLKIIAKILTGYTGNIFVNQTNLKDYKKPFAYMPQNHLLLAWKTLLQNITVPLILQGMSFKDATKIAKPYLKEFGLESFINNYPDELSGGQKQRTALLRSILVSSNFLLLDEPFSQLDAITRFNLQNFLYSIYQKYNYTALLVTHDIDEAILLANKVSIISNTGHIIDNFSINLPKNNNEETILSNDFLNYKKQITKSLKTIAI